MLRSGDNYATIPSDGRTCRSARAERCRQVATLRHVGNDVSAANELAFHVQLWKRGPGRINLHTGIRCLALAALTTWLRRCCECRLRLGHHDTLLLTSPSSRMQSFFRRGVKMGRQGLSKEQLFNAHLESRSHRPVAEDVERAESDAAAAQGSHHLRAEAALRPLRRSLRAKAQQSETAACFHAVNAGQLGVG